jgi:small-conductance mechanosensitive channel
MAIAADEAFYEAAERRIEYLALLIGATGTICAWIFWGVRTGAGVAVGAAISWINFRWMKQGVNTLVRLSTVQQGAENVRVPMSVYFKFLGRYVLLVLAAYAILHGFRLIITSVLAGFFAVVAAVLIEMLGQLFRARPQPRSGS